MHSRGAPKLDLYGTTLVDRERIFARLTYHCAERVLSFFLAVKTTKTKLKLHESLPSALSISYT